VQCTIKRQPAPASRRHSIMHNRLSAQGFSQHQRCFPMRVMGTVTSPGVGTLIRSISV
jgi:hypothetical protein